MNTLLLSVYLLLYAVLFATFTIWTKRAYGLRLIDAAIWSNGLVSIIVVMLTLLLVYLELEVPFDLSPALLISAGTGLFYYQTDILRKKTTQDISTDEHPAANT